MTKTTDPAALNEWIAIGRTEDVPQDAERRTRLLGQDIVARRTGDAPQVFETDADGGDGRECPIQERYGHVWTTLGTPDRDMLDMPEFEEDGRRLVTCGIVTVRTSPLRILENFLDLAHFPFVHRDILGAEPNTEVEDYKVEIRADTNDLWATQCRFFQPQAAKSAADGQDTEYMYRVTSPFVTVLYKTCPIRPGTWDLIGIFVQPREEDLCDVHSFVLPFDEDNTDVELIQFQQMIFLQDRRIIEDQRPRLLPLDSGIEVRGRADDTSIAFRRWLRARGQRFGVDVVAA